MLVDIGTVVVIVLFIALAVATALGMLFGVLALLAIPWGDE